ncbi:MAG: hypothetical protein RIC14_00400 [Filomicrobium sp.]
MARPNNCPPVLFLVFNRPDYAGVVFEAIRQAAPQRLYIAADGPRDRPGEAELCAKVREVTTAVDWECEVKTLFRDENLGCGKGVSSGVSWFFENEEAGIVLEDDCLPSMSFFRYCEELLETYRDDPRVLAISGSNFQRGQPVMSDSYFFSRQAHCWGWASWRRAWNQYDFEMSHWPAFRDGGGLRAWSIGNPVFEDYWTLVMDKTADKEVDTWDYQWILTGWLHNGLTCTPVRNLVTNVGIGPTGAHPTTGDYWFSHQPAAELEFPLKHPQLLAWNAVADEIADWERYNIKPFDSGREAEEKLVQAMDQMEEITHQFRAARAELGDKSRQLVQAKNTINRMEASRFWKLRDKFASTARYFGIRGGD